VSNKQSYYYALSFPFNERVDMSELYEAKWNSNNDSKREREPMKEKRFLIVLTVVFFPLC
jgi:hypothetical protein